MQQAIPAEFQNILGALSETYHRDVSETEARTAWAALRDLPLDDIRRAAFALIKTSKFFPVPAAIREQVRASGPISDTLGPGPKEVKLLSDVTSQRRDEQRDPAVRVALQLHHAWAERERMLAEGVSLENVDKGLAAVLMDVHPPTRKWVFYCDDCRDTGLLTCKDGRSSYPCEHCERGRRYQPIAQAIQADRERRGWM